MERQKQIMKELQRNNSIYKNDPYAKEFGINIAQLTGRFLPPPSILYKQEKQVMTPQHNTGK